MRGGPLRGEVHELAEQRYLCQRYKENIERPVSVQIMTMGLDEITTELRVIAPWTSAASPGRECSWTSRRRCGSSRWWCSRLTSS